MSRYTQDSQGNLSMVAGNPSLPIDSALSNTSTNAVQNRVISDALDNKVDIADLGTAAVKDSTNAVTQASTDLVESGAVYTEISKTYKYTDTSDTSMADEDYIPFYDTSAQVMKKIAKSDVSFGDGPGKMNIDGSNATGAVSFPGIFMHGDGLMANKWADEAAIPYNFSLGAAVVFNNEIHILGGTNSLTSHYKWDGTSWTSVSTLPYDFKRGCAVVYGDELHILGSEVSGYYTAHYKWDGSSWTSVSTLPYNFYSGAAVVYGDELHILGSDVSGYYTSHYKWDGTSWTSVSALPYNFRRGCAVVFESEIHILGGYGSSSIEKNHYKWNGVSWSLVSTLPYLFTNGTAALFNNEIHIIGSSITGYSRNHYKWDNSSWSIASVLPYAFSDGSSVVYDGEIHVLEKTNHYKSDCVHYSDGQTAHAEGYFTAAIGNNSHSEGQETMALGNNSHAEGYKSVASGQVGHAEGYQTSAAYIYSHAEGNHTEASGESSHAEGSDTIASGDYAHAEGFETFAMARGSHAQGKSSVCHTPWSAAMGIQGVACSGGLGTIEDNDELSGNDTSVMLAMGGSAISDGYSSEKFSRGAEFSDHNVFAVDDRGNFFSQGAQSLIRGTIKGILVASGPSIDLEDGACYILYANTRVTATGAWRGAQAYYIAASWPGTGVTTTAQGSPKIAALGTVGTVGVNLASKAVAYTSGSTTYYRSQLGIGTCTTALTARYSLVKVLGSLDDFENPA